jgi:hypothetical protein
MDLRDRENCLYPESTLPNFNATRTHRAIPIAPHIAIPAFLWQFGAARGPAILRKLPGYSIEIRPKFV